MKNFNPRHLRKKFVKKSGASGPEKGAAFRRCKQISDKFIHQSASYLESKVGAAYESYCNKTRAGLGFRR